ncbi:NAD(P)-dependent oxidoreductase, partial [Marinitenerispora sediminis]
AAFGMTVLAWSANLTAERAEREGARPVGREELLRASDVVTLHLKLSDRTRGLIGRRELELIGPDGYLVNTSRGPIVDEGALLDALTSGGIAGAALDVYATEPLPPDHPLRTAPNTVLTPHIGYGTQDTYDIFFRETVADVLAFLGGAPVRVLN